jgi:hypothetical protein
MGGKVSIDCEKTGYSANIEFLTKVCLFPREIFSNKFSINSHFIMVKNIKSLEVCMDQIKKNSVKSMENGMA